MARPSSVPHRWPTWLVLLLLLLAAAGHWRAVTPYQPLDRQNDVDAIEKLTGIERAKTLADVGAWFIGDDPQQAHSFRPVAAVTLWLEFRLWGWHRAAYQAANLAWLVLTGLALIQLGRVLLLPEAVAVALGVLLLVWPTRGSNAMVYYVATRSDLLCGLFCVLAVTALLAYLESGRRRTVFAFACWSLLGYLGKEHGVVLLPISLALAVLLAGRRPEGRRALLTAVVVAAVWGVWHACAERNMHAALHPGHSFGDQWRLLRVRWPTSLEAYAYQFYAPLGELTRLVFVIRMVGAWFTSLPYVAMLHLAFGLWGLRVLWRTDRRTLAVVLAWKLFAYLPVLPFHDLYPWYDFIPHLLDRLFPLAVLARWWTEPWPPRGSALAPARGHRAR